MSPQVPRVEVVTDGVLSTNVRRMYRQVFGNDIDLVAWADRMQPGASWSLTTPSAFLIAHRRGSTVNVWLMGVLESARGSGEFRLLVQQLVMEVGWSSRLTMTTRPSSFQKMFAILSTYAQRCDEPEDAAAGKVRFSTQAWVVVLALQRRSLAVGVACGSACCATMLAARGQRWAAAVCAFLGCSAIPALVPLIPRPALRHVSR